LKRSDWLALCPVEFELANHRDRLKEHKEMERAYMAFPNISNIEYNKSTSPKVVDAMLLKNLHFSFFTDALCIGMSQGRSAP
jgi:hypothetical protein